MLSVPSWPRSLCTAGLALAVIPFIAPGAPGQEPAEGERIRVRTVSESPGKVTGVLETREPDYLVVQTEDATPTTIAWADISRLEVSRGTKSNAVLGAAVGGLVGLGVSLAVTAGVDWGEYGGYHGLAVAGATLAGGLFGLGVGSAIRVDRWVDVPPDRWRVEVAPDPNGGVAVGLNLRL